MLITEWKMEDALAVSYEEGREMGIEEGMKDAARKALAEGVSIEVVKKITGLDDESLKNLENGANR